MKSIKRLPGRADGAEGLTALAEVFGPAEVFDLILLCRTARSRDDDAGGDALVTLARAMVAAEMEKSNVDYDTARKTVAYRLGYRNAGTRSNFYQILKGGRSPSKQANSQYRDRERNR